MSVHLISALMSVYVFTLISQSLNDRKKPRQQQALHCESQELGVARYCPVEALKGEKMRLQQISKSFRPRYFRWSASPPRLGSSRISGQGGRRGGGQCPGISLRPSVRPHLKTSLQALAAKSPTELPLCTTKLAIINRTLQSVISSAQSCTTECHQRSGLLVS